MTITFIVCAKDMGSPGEYFFGLLLAKGSVICDKFTGNIIKLLEQDEFHWFWKFPYYDFNILIPQTKKIFKLKISPISSNPEVRRLTIGVVIKPPTTIEDYHNLNNKLGYEFPNFSETIMSLLYDFCEEKSNFLSTLYNPKREEQQKQFRDVIFESLTPKLAEFGLTITYAVFYFED